MSHIRVSLIILLYLIAGVVTAADNFTVTPNNLSEIPLNTLQTFTVHWDKDGTPQENQQINLSKTFGDLIIDTIPLQTDSNGDAVFSMRSAEAGETTVTISTATAGPAALTLNFSFAQTQVELSITTSGEGTGIITAPIGLLGTGIESGCENGCNEQYAPETEITLTATADANASFAGWSGDCTDFENPATFTLTTDMECTANFGKQAFLLTVNSVGNGSVGVVPPDPMNCDEEGLKCTGQYESGTDVTLTAEPETNALFEGWTGDCADLSNPATLTLTSAQTCTANFALKTYNLNVNLTGEGLGTVTSDPAGIQCQTGDTDCSATYDGGTTVTLTPTATTGSVFTGWDGTGCLTDGEDATVAMVTLNKATTCSANFQPLLDVQVTVTGEGSVTSSPSGIDCGATCQAQFAKDTTIRLTATPTTEDAVFIEWIGDACVNSTDTTIALKLDTAKSCAAQFITATPISGGVITTVAGNGAKGYTDNVPALEAALRTPSDMVVDNQGNLYIADTFNSVVRKVINLNDPDTSTHLITTIAGDGTIGYSGEGVNGTTAQLHWPYGITKDAENNLYIADTLNNLIRKLTVENTITTYAGDITKAGNKTGGYSGDGAIATYSAEFNQPRSVAVDAQGNLYIADFLNNVIRKVDATSKIITTVVGTGIGGYSGDGGPANEAKLNLPSGIAVDTEGTLYIADSANRVVRKVSFGEGTATISSLESTNGLDVVDVAVDTEGTLYLVEKSKHVIQQLAVDGTLSIVAGIAGEANYITQEDGGPANQAHLNSPVAISIDSGGNLYIADSGNHRIRMVTLKANLLLEKTETGTGQGSVLIDDSTECNDATLTNGCINYFPTNSKIRLEAVAAEGFAFTHWEGDCTGTENPKTLLLNEGKHCAVNFEPLYELMIETPSTGQGFVSSTPSGIQCGETCQKSYPKGTTVSLIAQADADSLFAGWTGDCSAVEEEATVTLDAAKTCQAIFELLPELTVEILGSGKVIGEDINCGSQCSAIYQPDTSVTLTAQPDMDERFMGWSGDCNGSATSFTLTMDTAKNCTANFAPTPRLTVQQSGKGQGTIVNDTLSIDCGEDCEEEFAGDTNVTINAVAGGGSRFIGWEGDCLGLSNPATVFVNTALVCTANFGLLPGLTINLSGNGVVTSDLAGIQCGDDCTEPYPDNTVVTLTATPQPDSRFVEWSGDCLGATNPLPVTVVGTLQCTANFELLNINDTFTVYPDSVPGVLLNTQKSFSVHWDRAGIPQAGQTVNISATLGTIEPASIVLDDNGNGQFSITSAVEGATTVTVATDTPITEGGHEITLDFEFFYSDDYLVITPDDKPYVLVNTEQLFTVHWDKAGVPQANATLNLSATLGTVPETVVTDAEGNATFTAFSAVAGVTVITVTADLPSAQVSFNFVDNFSSIQFAAPTYYVNEIDGKVILLVSRAASEEGIVSASFDVVDGTAIVDVDYQRPAEPFTVTWTDLDSTHKTISIPILKDPAAEADKTFTVRLTGVSGNALLGENVSATVIIVDTPNVGSLQFSASDYRASEEEGQATITVDRIGGSAGDVSVGYSTKAGSAKVGQDYLHTEGTLRWGQGEVQSQQFTVPILMDNQTEAEEALTLALANPTGGAKIGAIATATLRLVDDLATPTTPIPETSGVIQLTESEVEVSEGAGSITFTVTRTQGKKGVVAVNYKTVAQTAQASRDFMAISGELRWLADDDLPQTIKLDLVDNATVEEAETLLLVLSEPRGGATLGVNTQAVITIQDDDATHLQFETDNTVVKPGQTSVTVIITRTGSDIGQVSVAYTTLDDTAKVNSDYQKSSGTLVWASADMKPKTITVPLLATTTLTERSFSLELSNITGNASLGEFTRTVILLPNASASDCKPVKVIDCYLINEETLRDVTVTKEGAIVGGSLGGSIKNDGVIQNVRLLSGTTISAGPFETGILKGSIQGDPDNPAEILQQSIRAETVLSNVMLGQGVRVDPSALLKKGVCFKNNSLIPPSIALEGILGVFKTTTLKHQAVKLTSDVLCYPAFEGIVGAINGLPAFYNEDFVLKQNLLNGYLELDLDVLHYTTLPIQARQSWLKSEQEGNAEDDPLGLVINGGEVMFITHTGREIKSITVPQAPQILRDELNKIGLNTLLLQANGSLQVPNGEIYYSARANLFSEEVDMPLGMNSTDLVPPVSTKPSWLAETDWILGVPAVYLVFAHADGSIRQQFFYPAPADPESLDVLGESAEPSELEGRLIIQQAEGEPCVGILDYLVLHSDDPIIRSTPRCLDIEDVNGDGFTDYAILFPNGDRQTMYRLP